MQGSVKRRRAGYCCDETILCVRVFVCQCDGRMNCEKQDELTMLIRSLFHARIQSVPSRLRPFQSRSTPCLAVFDLAKSR